MIENVFDKGRKEDVEFLNKVTMLADKMRGEDEVIPMNLNLPILHASVNCVIGDLVRVEVMESQKIKGWVYSNVHAVTFPIKGRRVLIRRTVLENMVKEGCKLKTYVEEPTLFGLHRLDDRIVAYLSAKDIQFNSDITY